VKTKNDVKRAIKFSRTKDTREEWNREVDSELMLKLKWPYFTTVVKFFLEY